MQAQEDEKRKSNMHVIYSGKTQPLIEDDMTTVSYMYLIILVLENDSFFRTVKNILRMHVLTLDCLNVSTRM